MARPKAFAQQDALQAAMQTFWRNGYHRTTMQDLVEAMGINRASLYDTFTDKYSLYLTALCHYRDLNLAELAEAIDEASSATARLQALFDKLITETLEDNDQRGCFLTNATLEMIPHYPDVQRIVAENHQQLTGVVQRVLSDGVAEGDFRADMPQADMVACIVSQLNGLRITGKLTPHIEPLKAIAHQTIQLILTPAPV